MNNIDINNNYKETILYSSPKIFNIYIFIVIYFILICLCIFFIEYPKNYLVTGIKKDNIITLYLDNTTIKHLNNNILYENSKISYELLDINYVDDYYIVNIKTDKQFNETNINFVINDGKSNIYKDFIKKIWKGFET